MVPWERCCSGSSNRGSSTSGSQIVILWFLKRDVMVPKAIRYLTHGTQNVGFLNHVAFNLGTQNAGSLGHRIFLHAYYAMDFILSLYLYKFCIRTTIKYIYSQIIVSFSD